MARIFVSGSATGLGLLAGKELLANGHDAIFHARNAARAEDIKREVDDASSVVVGDISTATGALVLADQVNALGPVDAVIHNAGVGYGGSPRPTADGFPDIFAVNVLAPYILTARISGPRRLVYLSSSMHRVSPNLHDILWRTRRWTGRWPIPRAIPGDGSGLCRRAAPARGARQCGRSGLGSHTHGRRRCSGRSRKRLRYPGGSRHFERANFRRAHWAVPLPYGGAAA